LRAYRDRMELFPNYFMNFPTSNHARTTILTGLHSPRAAIPQLAPRIPVRSLFELFREAGYSTAVFDSCFTEYARFRDFLNARAIDTLLDFHNMPGRDDYERLQWGLPEECTMKAIIDHLRGHAGGERPFFLTYMPVAPHYPYDTRPDEFAVFEGPSPLFTGDYTIRYKNELLYMDWVISSIIDELRALGLLDRTVVVITNDHGERLGDGNGRLGHGWELEPELINQPLIVMDPKRPGARVNREPGSHVDLLPTVLDLAGIAVPADELYQGRSLYRTLGWRKRIHLNSYDHRGVIADGCYLLEEPRGRSVPSVIRSFRIDDSGDRARFVPAEHAYSVTEQMDLFEPFQESLIEHYGHYREVWRRRKQVDRPTD
jgi:arylsulfatase A-like enzyme